MDPLAEKYYDISPYAQLGCNPINIIDSSGKDIIVLNAPKGGQFLGKSHGHMAVLIGNDKTGWRYISKNGRENENSNVKDNPIVGGKPKVDKDKKFKTYEEFDSDKELSPTYSQRVRLKTDSDQDKAAENAAIESAVSRYHGIFANCADIVSDALVAAGLDPGYVTIYGTPTGIQRSIPTSPNERIKYIKNNNKSSLYPAEEGNNNSQSQEKKPTWAEILSTLRDWLMRNPCIIVK